MKKILVVEDDKDISRAMSIRLKSAGYDVVIAHDAVLAASVAAKTQPDLVILDISLPGGDGFTVAERLQDILCDVPTIFVTASKRPGLTERALKLGAVALLEKPYDAQILLGLVHSAIHADKPPVA